MFFVVTRWFSPGRSQNLIFFFALLAVGPDLSAAEPTRALAPQAMALLKGNCFGCHNPEKKKGGLLLTSRQDLLKGGENGPVVVLGQGEKSKLVHALSADADPHMPPKKQLTDKQIAVLRGWIDEGAKWNDKAVAAFGLETPLEKVGALPHEYQPVLAVALSRDGKTLVVARGSSLSIYNATNGTEATVLNRHRDAIQALAWSNDGKKLASASYREIYLWNAENWQPVRRITNDLVGRITAVAFSPDGAVLAGADGVVTRSGVVRLWDTSSGKQLASWEAHRDSITSTEFSHDGKLLATAGADRQAKLFDVSTRKEVAKFEGHSGHLLALGFNADDSMLATAGADKILNFWDTKTKEQKITLQKHTAPLTGLSWSANGKTLGSVGEDGVVRVYTDFKAHNGKEQSEGAQMRTVATSTNEVLYSVALAPDGKTLYAGGHSGNVYVWSSDGKLKRTLQPKDANQKLAATGGMR